MCIENISRRLLDGINRVYRKSKENSLHLVSISSAERDIWRELLCLKKAFKRFHVDGHCISPFDSISKIPISICIYFVILNVELYQSIYRSDMVILGHAHALMASRRRTLPYNYTTRQWRLLRSEWTSLLGFFPGDKRPSFFNALSVDVVGVWIMFHDFTASFLDLCSVVQRSGSIVHVIISACMYVV